MMLEQLRAWLGSVGIDREEWLWALEIFVIIFVTLIASYMLRRFFNRLGSHLKNNRTPWDDMLLDAASRPAALGVWVIGFSWALQVVDERSVTTLLSAVNAFRDVAVVGLLAWFLIRLIAGAEAVLVAPDKVSRPMDQTTAHAIGKLLRASIIITAALVTLQTLGFSVSGVLAFGGIGGIAVGFAARDLLANFFGGLMIYLDRPFSVGDWVRSPDKNIEGTVEYIGWRQTRIRTFDKRPLYVPNATFANISVENPSRMTNRRIYETVGVRYDDAACVEAIIAEVKQMLLDHPAIDTEQTLIVNLNKFGPSSLDFFIYTFTKTTNWVEFHEIKQDVMVKVMAIIGRQGAEIAFPTTTVHLADAPAAIATASDAA